MNTYVEVWGPDEARLVPLGEDRATVGRGESNDVVLGDPTVSNFHAVLEHYPSGWCLRDVGSSNGSFVNGERVVGERQIHPGDELRVGATRLVFRSEEASGQGATVTAAPPPDVTKRERDVLVALCRPLMGGGAFNRPATIKEMATSLVVSEAAIKAHLINLYDKFGIHDREESRRVQLAEQAVLRRAVTIADLTA